MAKIIKQFKNNGVTGFKIYEFGVQAPPGSVIIFNEDDQNMVTIGSTGIFQAELNDGAFVTSIQVNNTQGKDYYIDVIMEESEG